MPTYTYSCSCGWQGDLRAGYDERERDCPACAARMERGQVYAVNGSGFAIPPMGARGIPMKRFIEAQGQMTRDAERTGKPAPDVLGMAQRAASHIRRHAPELVSGT